MPSPANLSFESGSAGVATSWTLSGAGTAEDVGLYVGADGEDWPEETFEQWDPAMDDYSSTITSVGAGNEEPFTAWFTGQDAYSDTISGAAAGNTESFESSWTADGFSATISSSTAGNDEDYEADWSNDGYQDTLGGGDVTAGDYSIPGNTDPFEAFEYPVPDFVFTAEIGSEVLQSPGHTLVNDTAIYLVSTNTLPGPYNYYTRYYVISAVAGVSFKLNTVPGGSTGIEATDLGIGEHNTTADPSLYWPSLITEF